MGVYPGRLSPLAGSSGESKMPSEPPLHVTASRLLSKVAGTVVGLTGTVVGLVLDVAGGAAQAVRMRRKVRKKVRTRMSVFFRWVFTDYTPPGSYSFPD